MAFIKLIDRFVGEFNDLVKYFKQRSKTKYYGDRFEEWVVQNSNIKPLRNSENEFWKLLEWRGDKCIIINDVTTFAAESNSDPDLLLQCITFSNYYENGEIIAVECKWRQKLGNEFWINETDIIKYQNYLRNNQRVNALFYIIGIGWENNHPEELYLIKLKDILDINIKTRKTKKDGIELEIRVRPIYNQKLQNYKISLNKPIMYWK